MDSFKSEPQTINASANLVYEKLSNPSVIQEKVDMIPEQYREKLNGVKFDKDSISFSAGPIGDVKLAITERVPGERITFSPSVSPVKFNLVINLKKVDDSHCTALTELQADLNPFLKTMVGGKLSEGAKKFGELIAKIPFNML